MKAMSDRPAVRCCAVVAAASLGAGCATVMRGPTEMLRIETQPSGATVAVANGRETCVAPCQLQVRRRGELTVTAEMDGCGRAEVPVASRIDRFGGWMLGAYGGVALGALAYDVGEDVGHAVGEGLAVALVCGGLGVDPEICVPESGEDDDSDFYTLLPAVPAAVDLLTGAVFAREPNPLRIELDCGRGSRKRASWRPHAGHRALDLGGPPPRSSTSATSRDPCAITPGRPARGGALLPLRHAWLDESGTCAGTRWHV